MQPRSHYYTPGVSFPHVSRKMTRRVLRRVKQPAFYPPVERTAVRTLARASAGRQGKNADKRDLIALARRETGRPTMGWNATKKYMRKLDNAAKAGLSGGAPAQATQRRRLGRKPRFWVTR